MSQRTGRLTTFNSQRRYFIGGSDARIIMGDDEAALLRLWREKRGEAEPADLSGNLVVRLGVATEALNRRWYEANTGQILTDVQRQIRHPALRWMATTQDGRVEATGEVFEAKFMLLGVLGGRSGREVHAAAAAQYVGHCGAKCCPFRDYRRWQMGRDHHPCRSALPTFDRYC
jgi:predicted phage-related endonuclease